MQIGFASFFCILYLAIQQQARPYRNDFDNYLGLVTSLMLVITFFACGIFKLKTFTELEDIQVHMSKEQKDDFDIPILALTAVLIVSIFGALLFSIFLLAMQEIQYFRDKEGLTRRELRKKLRDDDAKAFTNTDDKLRREVMLNGLDKAEQSTEKLEAASYLFGTAGISPIYWSLRKEDLQVFRKLVQDALARGEIRSQSDPSKRFYYPPEKFHDPAIGPNMHSVNAGLIKPLTLDGTSDMPAFIPGLSYSVSRNYATGGLKCELFFSHAWDEGVFELIDNALNAWPSRCTGAYICCFSNPQNLDIAKLLGTSIVNSPFDKILRSGVVTDFVMLANSNTPIHSRLWCVFEAYKAREQKIRNLGIAGDPVNLLTGKLEMQLRKEEQDATTTRDHEEASMKSDINLLLRSPELLGEDVNGINIRVGEQLYQFRFAQERVAQAKLDVLAADDDDLIDISKADCSFDGDRQMIMQAVQGKEDKVRELIVSLLRDCVCGVSQVPRGEMTAPGSLGLSLTDMTVDLTRLADLNASSLLQLQFAGWLRLRPKVCTLVVTARKLPVGCLQLLHDALDTRKLRELRKIVIVGEQTQELLGLVEHVKQRVVEMSESDHQSCLGIMRPGPNSPINETTVRRMRTGWRSKAAAPIVEEPPQDIPPVPLGALPGRWDLLSSHWRSADEAEGSSTASTPRFVGQRYSAADLGEELSPPSVRSSCSCTASSAPSVPIGGFARPSEVPPTIEQHAGKSVQDLPPPAYPDASGASHRSRFGFRRSRDSGGASSSTVDTSSTSAPQRRDRLLVNRVLGGVTLRSAHAPRDPFPGMTTVSHTAPAEGACKGSSSNTLSERSETEMQI